MGAVEGIFVFALGLLIKLLVFGMGLVGVLIISCSTENERVIVYERYS